MNVLFIAFGGGLIGAGLMSGWVALLVWKKEDERLKRGLS